MRPVLNKFERASLYSPSASRVRSGSSIYWFPLGIALTRWLVESDNDHHYSCWLSGSFRASTCDPRVQPSSSLPGVVHRHRPFPQSLISMVGTFRCISDLSLSRCACRNCLFSFFWAVTHSFLFSTSAFRFSPLRASISFPARSAASLAFLLRESLSLLWLEPLLVSNLVVFQTQIDKSVLTQSKYGSTLSIFLCPDDLHCQLFW